MSNHTSIILVLIFLSGCINAANETGLTSTRPHSFFPKKDSLPAPTLSMDSIIYPFIAYEKNIIQADSHLSFFFQQLQRLESGELQQVRIAHIGDSHIQADFFPGKMRYLLQHRFGNAGRGLVFPYRQAGTHSPVDFKSESKQEFEQKRSVFKKEGPTIGISGMSIRSQSSDFAISFYQKERNGWLQGFDQVSIFTPPGDSSLSYELFSGEKRGMIVAPDHLFQKKFRFDTIVTAAQLSVVQQAEAATKGTIHGLLLENTQAPGILYNMMGVNGTTYFHFNRCEYLLPQIQLIRPDLIVISLGTNEALTSNFRPADLAREAEKFIRHLKESCPQSSILITTLPDAWQKKQAPAPQAPAARAVLLELARRYACGLWDLNEIMGGKGAMQHWVEAELGYVDYIHFTQLGYELQADLLYTALMNAYR